jgi:hypothetical protein
MQAQHNHIRTIDLHAFSGLAEIIILNLSYNHFDYILPATYEDTQHLQLLYLRETGSRHTPDQF